MKRANVSPLKQNLRKLLLYPIMIYTFIHVEIVVLKASEVNSDLAIVLILNMVVVVGLLAFAG